MSDTSKSSSKRRPSSRSSSASSRNQSCIPCGIRASYLPCDGIRSGVSCTSCRNSNTFCFFRPDFTRKAVRHKHSGTIFKSSSRVIEYAHSSRLKTEYAGSRAEVGRVVSSCVWSKRTTDKACGQTALKRITGLFCPDLASYHGGKTTISTTLFPNAMMPDQPASPSHDAQDLEESDMQNVPDSNLQDSDRFTLPNNELLQQIHQLAKEISAGKLFMAGALESSVLIALGILVQEMEMMENSPETYEMLDDRLVASKAPNLFDVFGSDIVKKEEQIQQVKPLLAESETVALADDHRFLTFLSLPEDLILYRNR